MADTGGGRRPAPGQGVAARCTGLVKRYEDVTAVAGLDLAVAPGECFGLLGPNGAGKTTTMEVLEGLTRPDEGVVEVLGCRWGSGRDHELRERLGVQLQETQLGEKLTVEETLRLFASFFTRSRPVGEVIATVELEEKRRARVGKLSGGQKQRLALACALVSDPDLLFLDEPTTGLDPQARLRVWDVVERFRARGGTVLLTTHSMEEATRLCDRVAIMDHGRILTLGRPDALVAALGADQIVEFRAQGEVARERLAGLPGVGGAIRAGDAWQLSVRRIDEALPALLAELERSGVALESLATHQATLEDVFVSLTGRALRDA
ncbi:MAG: ABC transporter ATP-binding protein [Thermoanaerobaculaceae bacterium]|nr:ABC transporter ATP-binding protein [Thermoanaerobaculaceae bacterium]TAM48683.1 MAG: ABC transporter ATP-binding protein [Acidobacteriota bacterium]